jgi:hypothetical protein
MIVYPATCDMLMTQLFYMYVTFKDLLVTEYQEASRDMSHGFQRQELMATDGDCFRP